MQTLKSPEKGSIKSEEPPSIFNGMHFNDNYKRDSNVTFLLVHGCGTNSNSFSEIFSKLSPNFGVVSLDLLGFGDSRIDKTGSLHDSTIIIKDYILEKNLKNVIAVGHSMGGIPVQRLSYFFPESIMAGVLINSMDNNNPHEIKAVRDGLRSIFTSFIPDHYFASNLYSNISKASPHVLGELIHTIRNGRYNSNLINFLNSTLPDKINFSEIQKTILILSSSNDRIVNPQTSKTLASKLPNSIEYVLGGGGHMIIDENADLIYQLLVSFSNNFNIVKSISA